jgi:ligand-binding SRPBCC domain-containing protein
MPVVTARSWVAAPLDDVFRFFDDPANLSRLMPRPVAIRLVRVDPAPPRPGSVFEFRYGLGPLERPWTVRLLERVPGQGFVDETLSGPMARFHHTHTFRASRRGGTWIEDRVDFHVGPDGWQGAAIDFVAGLVMRAIFVWRHAMQRAVLRA